jgi:glucosamine-6-phosphate deaminase
MEVNIKDTYEEICEAAAILVAQTLQFKQDAVLGLATGSTPVGVYRELIRMHKEDGLDFSQVTTFNLDEYLGLRDSHAQSYHYFMQENFFKHINIRDDKTHVPSGVPEDVTAYSEQYEQQIREAGGIDLQILGIGSDGHIAFNEPGSPLDSRTRVEALTQQTIQDNSRFFDRVEDVPTEAITMGVGTILEARKIILLASGESKSTAVADAIDGLVSSACTASALQRHSDVTILLDRPAASKLKQSADFQVTPTEESETPATRS